MNTLYLKHKLTLYHFRHSPWTHLAWNLKRKLPGSFTTSLSHCNCGWHCWWVKKHHIFTHFRWLTKCSWRGCDWDEPSEIQTGPAWQDDEGGWHSAIDEGPDKDVFTIGSFIMCERCYRIKNV